MSSRTPGSTRTRRLNTTVLDNADTPLLFVVTFMNTLLKMTASSYGVVFRRGWLVSHILLKARVSRFEIWVES